MTPKYKTKMMEPDIAWHSLAALHCDCLPVTVVIHLGTFQLLSATMSTRWHTEKLIKQVT